MAVAWWLAGDGALTDPACKDPLRLYYGSKGGEVRPNWSVLGAATLDYVQEEYRKAFPPRRALQTPLRVVDHAPARGLVAVSYTHLRAHETVLDLVCRLLLEKKKTRNRHHSERPSTHLIE